MGSIDGDPTSWSAYRTPEPVCGVGQLAWQRHGSADDHHLLFEIRRCGSVQRHRTSAPRQQQGTLAQPISDSSSSPETRESTAPDRGPRRIEIGVSICLNQVRAGPSRPDQARERMWVTGQPLDRREPTSASLRLLEEGRTHVIQAIARWCGSRGVGARRD